MRIKEGNVASISEREERQVEQANASGKTPVVFIHGLWLLPSSWDRWVGLFEENGYAGVARIGRMTPRPSRWRGRNQRSSRRSR